MKNGKMTLEFDDPNFCLTGRGFSFLDGDNKITVSSDLIIHIELIEKISANSYYGRKVAKIFCKDFTLEITLRKKSIFAGNKKDLQNLDKFKELLNLFHEEEIPIKIYRGSENIQRLAYLSVIVFLIFIAFYLYSFGGWEEIKQKSVVLLIAFATFLFQFILLWKKNRIEIYDYADVKKQSNKRYVHW